jgi:hypothetical protein
VKAATALVLAAGLLVLFGCGGGDSAHSSLTKAEFIKKVNQACRQEDEVRTQAKAEKQKELGLEPGEIANPGQHEQIVEATVVPYEKMTDQLEELIPSDQVKSLEPLIEAREGVAKIVRESNSADTILPYIKKANERAVQYGLKECFI